MRNVCKIVSHWKNWVVRRFFILHELDIYLKKLGQFLFRCYTGSRKFLEFFMWASYIFCSIFKVVIYFWINLILEDQGINEGAKISLLIFCLWHDNLTIFSIFYLLISCMNVPLVWLHIRLMPECLITVKSIITEQTRIN